MIKIAKQLYKTYYCLFCDTLILTPFLGESVAASLSDSGTSVSSHSVNENFRSRVAKAILASSMAKRSPTQFRGPAPKGIQASG